MYQPTIWKRLSIFIGICALVASAHAKPGATYQSPDFDFPLFDPDAISLTPADRNQTVDALSALARNFGDDGVVDPDLREKALAIALRLDPLSGPARQAHDSLSLETTPEPLQFLTSISKVATILLSSANKLQNSPPDSDDQILAPYILELGISVHPDPSVDHVKAYGQALDSLKKKHLLWEKFVTLSPGSPSEISLRRTLAELKGKEKSADKEAKAKVKIASNADRPSIFSEAPLPTPDTMEPSIPTEDPLSEEAATLARETVTIPYLGVSGEQGVPGMFELLVREPDETETSLLGLFGGDAETNEFEMRLRMDTDNAVTLGGLSEAEEIIRETFPVWPMNQIAMASFTAKDSTFSGRLDSILPAALALQSLFAPEMIFRTDVAIAGVAQESLDSLSLPTTVLTDILDDAKSFEMATLLVPVGAEETLMDLLLLAENPTYLIRPQLLEMADSDAYLEHLIEDRYPEVVKNAVSEFTEIEGLLEKGLTLRQIATNEVVQRRLEQIVEKCPHHLSARMLLAWGRIDESTLMTLSVTSSVDAVDEVLAPFILQYENARDGAGIYYPNVGDDLSQASSDLRRLSDKIDPQVTDYLRYAEDTLDPFDKFLSLRDKTTSSALQKRGDLSRAISGLETERSRLGLD